MIMFWQGCDLLCAIDQIDPAIVVSTEKVCEEVSAILWGMGSPISRWLHPAEYSCQVMSWSWTMDLIEIRDAGRVIGYISRADADRLESVAICYPFGRDDHGDLVKGYW